MSKLKDLTGQKFGSLTVIGRDESRRANITYWLCKCDCGNPQILSVARGSLTRGLTTSCGHARRKKDKSNQYDLSGGYGVGWTSNTNKEFYFDLEDYDKIKDYCWYENDSGYIVTQRDRHTIRLHRLVMAVTDPKIQVDHIFHNLNDNRKQFLRLVTNQENCLNKKSNGVYFDKEKNKWAGRLTYNGKTYFKRFDTIEEAIAYRKELEKLYFKRYAFIESDSVKYPCPQCGEELFFEGGCNICKACGWTKCD